MSNKSKLVDLTDSVLLAGLRKTKWRNEISGERSCSRVALEGSLKGSVIPAVHVLDAHLRRLLPGSARFAGGFAGSRVIVMGRAHKAIIMSDHAPFELAETKEGS